MTHPDMLWLVVASIVVGAGSVPLGIAVVALVDYIQRLRLNADAPDRLRIQYPVVAVELPRLVRKLTRRHGWTLQDCRLTLFSGNGRHFLADQERWRRTIRQWCDAGMVVECAYTDGDSDVRSVLATFARDTAGRFKPTVVDRSKTPLPCGVAQRQHMAVLAHADGGRAVWHEGHHNTGSRRAENVEWLSPTMIGNRRRLRQWVSRCEDEIRAMLPIERSQPA